MEQNTKKTKHQESQTTKLGNIVEMFGGYQIRSSIGISTGDICVGPNKQAHIGDYMYISQKKNSTNTNSLTGLTYADYQITDGNGHLTKGAMILEVTQGSSGWVSGLKAGDVILEVNHSPITNSQDLSK